MRALPRAGVAAALLLLAACAPLRVDISEEAAGGFRAVAHGEDAEGCREARTRVADEARFHCRARGLRPRLGNVTSAPEGSGCRVALPFWCTAE